MNLRNLAITGVIILALLGLDLVLWLKVRRLRNGAGSQDGSRSDP